MSVQTKVKPTSATIVGEKEKKRAYTRPFAASLRFDYIATILSIWLIGGVYLDGWAHNSIPQLESFFTPWHGVLYSGFGALAGFLTYNLIKNVRQGYPTRYALPVGYNISMLGVLIFLSGGIGDGVGHTLFGIEKGIEGLISPTHLQLALGGLLMLTGPIRSIWQRASVSGWRGLFPLIISMTLVLGVLNFFTFYANAVGQSWLVSTTLTGNVQNILARGVASVLLQTALLMGSLLLLIRYWQLPVGAVFTLVSVSTIGVCLMTNQWSLIPMALVAAVVSELLFVGLKPSATRPGAFRIFAFALPVAYFTCFFLTIQILKGISWTFYIWSGSIVLAGVAGLLLSYLVLTPMPRATTETETETAEA